MNGEFRVILALFVTILSGCHDGSAGRKTDGLVQASKDTIEPVVNSEQAARTFPFDLSESGGKYTIVAQIEGKDLYPKYYRLFKKYGYNGNGYCWEGHIQQILEKKDNQLLKHIDFDSEAGMFAADADSKEAQQKFVEILSPIFSDLTVLSKWVKKADHSRIDD